MTSVRLLADDLTGALDTAAEFVGLCGSFDVTWAEASAAPGYQSLAQFTTIHYTTPYIRQVPGMNCIQPTAPAELGPMLRPKFDSTLLIEASTSHGIP